MRGGENKARGKKTEKGKASVKERRKYLIAAACGAALVLILALLLAGGGEKRRYERYCRQAEESFQKGQYDQALSDLRKAEAIRGSEELLLKMADCYEAQENWDMALAALRKMDRNNPAVTERISALEQRRMQQQEGSLCVVAGESYDAAATELNLNGRELGDAVLREVLQLHALTRLSLADNRITDLSALSSLGGLRILDLSGNELRDISPLGKLGNLHSLNLDRNPLGDLSPLYGLEELSSLSLRGVSLREGELDALTAALPGCAILTDGDAEDVTSICLSGVRFDTASTQLDLSGLGLREVQCLGICTQLRSLNLADNEISDLSPLMNLQKLEKLKIAGNGTADLRPLIGLTGLRSLDASRNAVSETSAVGSLTALQSLDLSDNPIGDFSGLKKLVNLEFLRLENTGIGDEDLPFLAELNRLNRLALDRNEGITAAAMNSLKSALPNCGVSHGTLVYLVQLGGEDYRTDIESLCIENTELSDLFGFEKFYCLETVRLGRNRIENLEAFQNTHSREIIRVLDLSFNRIQDVAPLSALTNLEVLDLRNNQIVSLRPLMRMTQLKKLDLSGNPLTDRQIADLRQALPDCEILF